MLPHAKARASVVQNTCAQDGIAIVVVHSVDLHPSPVLVGMEKALRRFQSPLSWKFVVAGTSALHQRLVFTLHRHRLQVLPLEAKHNESKYMKQRDQVQGSIGLCVTPATDGVLSRLQDTIDAKKVFLEVCT